MCLAMLLSFVQVLFGVLGAVSVACRRPPPARPQLLVDQLFTAIANA